MPATAGRVRMPANNRVHSSAALQTHGIWQSAIGYDPYAPDRKDVSGGERAAAVPAGENAYDSFQGLLALAKIQSGQGSSTDEPRGACYRCKRVGHLPYQCRNFLAVAKEENGAVAVESNTKGGKGEDAHPESDAKGSDSDDDSDSDSDVDSEMERAIAKKMSSSSRKKRRYSSEEKKDDSLSSDESGDDRKRKRHHSHRSKSRKSSSKKSRRDYSSSDEDDSSRERRRRHHHRSKKSSSKRSRKDHSRKKERDKKRSKPRRSPEASD